MFPFLLSLNVHTSFNIKLKIIEISIANANDIDMDKSLVVDKNTSSFTNVPSPPTMANFSNLNIKRPTPLTPFLVIFQYVR